MCTLQGVRGKNICPYWAAASVVSCCQVPKSAQKHLGWCIRSPASSWTGGFMSTADLCALNGTCNMQRRGKALMNHVCPSPNKAATLTSSFFIPAWRGLWKPWERERAPHSFAGLSSVHTLKNQRCSSPTLNTICLLARKEIKFSAQWRT